MSASEQPWQACPICGGCGTVPHDFYTRLGAGTSTGRERCQRCSGLGTIVAPTYPTLTDIETAGARAERAEAAARDFAKVLRGIERDKAEGRVVEAWIRLKRTARDVLARHPEYSEESGDANR